MEIVEIAFFPFYSPRTPKNQIKAFSASSKIKWSVGMLAVPALSSVYQIAFDSRPSDHLLTTLEDVKRALYYKPSIRPLLTKSNNVSSKNFQKFCFYFTFFSDCHICAFLLASSNVKCMSAAGKVYIFFVIAHWIAILGWSVCKTLKSTFCIRSHKIM